MNAPSAKLVQEAAAEWLEAARAGVVRTRSGEPYKPSALRGYEAVLRRTICPRLGHLRLSALTRARIQDLVDRLVVAGLAPSTVANAVLPLRAIYRRAVEREEVAVNPTLGLALPKERRERDQVAEPREVEALLRVLPPHHRVLWSAAVYTGLRRGELQALLWSAVDPDAGVVRVERSWDRAAPGCSEEPLRGANGPDPRRPSHRAPRPPSGPGKRRGGLRLLGHRRAAV
jgi:integrase